MSRWRQRLLGTRVTLGQLGLVSVVSALVSAVIVVGALGETGPEKAVIGALRARQVIHESGAGPAGAAAQSSAVPAADTTSVPAPATPAAPPAAATPSADDSGSAASAATDTSAADTSDSSSADSGGSDDSGASDNSDSSGSSDDSASSGSSGSSSSGPAANKPTGAAAKVKHVFVVVVSTPSYAAAFGKGSAATYLNGTLRSKGVLLSGYHSLGGAQLPDYLAMVSGQAPNRDTEGGCSTYADFPGGASPAKDGLVPGAGCVYPNTALTVGDQLDGANLAWRGYMDGMASACQHPNSGAADTTIPTAGTATSPSSSTTTTTSTTSTTTTSATTTGTTGTSTTGAGTATTPNGGYETSENPFVYFHSLLDLGDCQSDDLPLTKLAGALHSTAATPHYAFISPDPCDTGTVVTCPVGKLTGIAAADAFLHQVVPGILASPAYRAGGAVVIAFTPAPGASGRRDRTVRTGALVLSPHAKPGTTVPGAYGPYSVLRTVEDVFGLTSLARAKSAHGFDQRVFTR